MFNSSRKLYTAFHSGCTKFLFHQQGTRVPFSLPPHQHLLLLVFLIVAILAARRQHLLVVSFAFPEDEGRWASSQVSVGRLDVFFGKVSIQVLWSVFNKIFHFFWFLFWCWVSILYTVWILTLCQVCRLQISSLIQHTVFKFCCWSFAMQKLFVLM